MAAFTTMLQAEQRAKALTADNTWLYAHSARDFNGAIIVRFMRYTTAAFALDEGRWIETDQDNVV